MSTTITGLGSGFDIDSWVSQLVSARKASTVTPLQSKLSTLQTTNSAVSGLQSKYQALQSALQTFTKTIYDSSSDMWTNTTINSSNSAYATASSSGTVSAASIDLEIEQIATATVARSKNGIGIINNTTASTTPFVNLANGQAKAGSFSMFLDGKRYNIDISEENTLSDVADLINNDEKIAGKIKASVDNDGKFTIESTDKNLILSLGASTDTSNLASVLKMHTKLGDGYGYTSNYSLSAVNTSVAMVNEDSGIKGIEFYGEDEEGNPLTSGTIKINGVEFKIDENTTLNGLISKINSNSDVNVKASFDSLSNQMVLTSTKTGTNNIALEEEGTNLLNILGFTEGLGDDEKIITGTQKLGDNAIVHINGNEIVSASNTITGESSGISNLSITVKKPTSTYSKQAEDDKKVTLDIEPDYSAVKNALNTFVKAYNDVVTSTKSNIASGGAIEHDASLNSILGQIKSITSSISSNDGEFSMLADIGISTSSTDATQLSIDNSKLEKALSENFESVKLLLSDGYIAKEDTGLFDRLLNNVNNVLDTTNGYFSSKTTSLDSQIKQINTRIERANTRLTTYENRITKQFNQMDAIISSLSTQLSTFQSYIG